MQRMLELIEETLDAEITPAELAEKSGYSLWHFLHLFQQEVGMPLCRYITRRRLAHAIWHISGGMSITDAALRWGFSTHSGFYRAFQREYAMSPSAWLRTRRVKAPRVPVLKEEHYKMLNRDLFRNALKRWGLDLPLTPVTWPGSCEISETSMYAGDGYVLKACRDDHSCRLAVALARALAEAGIPAAEVIPLPDGTPALPIMDGMYMMLCRRIPGRSLTAAELIRGPQKGHAIGAALARLHQATAALEDLPYAEDEPYADHLLTWALPRVQGILEEGFLRDFAARLEALRRLPTALIHRDPNPSNLIDTGEGVAFVDFELSRRFVRIFDLCYTATAVLSETFGQEELPWEENWPAFVSALAQGYGSVSPLSGAEHAALPTLLLGNELLAIAAFAGSDKYREVFEVNMRMLPWMMEHMPV